MAIEANRAGPATDRQRRSPTAFSQVRGVHLATFMSACVRVSTMRSSADLVWCVRGADDWSKNPFQKRFTQHARVNVVPSVWPFAKR